MGTISTDPIGFSAGDANLYRYVVNGPTYAHDPSGLERTVTLADGSAFTAQGTGHHRVPWSVFADEKLNFSRDVMEVFDGAGKGSLINGQWYNFHDGSKIGGISHTDYTDAVQRELKTFKKRYRTFGPQHAQKFLDHLSNLKSSHTIRVFNAGVAAERDLAKEIGDVLYEQYKKDAWWWTKDKTLKKRVLDEVGGYVRELRTSTTSKQKFMKTLLADISSKVPTKRIATAAAKRLGSALFVWAVVDQIAKDGEVNASEIPNAIVLNSPLVGDALQAGLGLGEVYLYLQDEVKSERTGDEWARSSTPYDPAKNHFKINKHGIDL